MSAPERAGQSPSWGAACFPVLAVLIAGCATPPPAWSEHGLYCYRSLADITCYAEPHPRDARRLVGYIGAAPPGAPAGRPSP
ncbi:MAG: hypothetical protein EA406_00245 [Rhodospirillales bacterium]|nr:MAG: hypothetical protein EA406_00245 [Rhodospirillales bacterium]